MRLININSGKNQKLLESCATLKEYSWFVEKVRENMTSNMALEDAVDSAINDMPKDYQIRKVSPMSKINFLNGTIDIL